MDNLFFITVAVLILAILFSMILAYRLYQDNQRREANLKNEVLSLLAEKAGADREELQEIRELVNALRRELKTQGTAPNLAPVMSALMHKLEMAEKAASSTPNLSPSGNRDDHSVFNHAIRLAKENHNAEKLVEICGIELAEAELIVRMHGNA